MKEFLPGVESHFDRKCLLVASTALQGRVIDGLGRPIDGRPELKYDEEAAGLGGSNALARENITEVLDTGIKAIDS